MAMGSCYTCIKYLMFAFNFLFWLLGCAMLGVGIWIRVDSNFEKYVSNSDEFDILYTAAYILIGIGVVIMVIGFLGCCGAIRESQCMLGTFFVLLFIIFAVLLGAGIWAAVAKDTVQEIADNVLQNAVDTYHEKASSKTFMDNIQRDFKCCGARNGLVDYKFTLDGMPVDTCGIHITTGCSQGLREFFADNLLIVAGVAIGIAVILILGMIFSMVLCCAIRDSIQ